MQSISEKQLRAIAYHLCEPIENIKMLDLSCQKANEIIRESIDIAEIQDKKAFCRSVIKLRRRIGI